MAHEQSFLLLAPPGVGKSDIVYQAAYEAGLTCRSLLGTQIAPEDVSGVPRIVGKRSVFCPPRVLLPEPAEPFCLFLDALPACAPDVQKAFYSLLLERRLGEFALPAGTWVVAAGNRVQDRALVRTMSSALVNRVTILQIRVDVDEWQAWAARSGVRADVRSFIHYLPDVLERPVPQESVPFSTPRAWALFSRSLDMAEALGMLNRETRRALAFGKLSPEDASVFCALAEETIAPMRPLEDYVRDPQLLPAGEAARWFILDCIRRRVRDERLDGVSARAVRGASSSTTRTTTSSTTCCAPSWASRGFPRAGSTSPVRARTAEEILLEMRCKGHEMASRTRVWEGGAITVRGRFRGPGGARSGSARNRGADEDGGDVLAAADPQTRAVLVITDGDVLYPDRPPPFDVLWLLPSGTTFPFTPRYGRVVRMD